MIPALIILAVFAALLVSLILNRVAYYRHLHIMRNFDRFVGH